jgi:predicted nuclease of predicted toxin-antitoxin system
MKFKLDENLGSRTAGIIAEFGHDVETITQEKLSGTSDERLFEIRTAECPCLITLDLDFSDVVRFPPRNTPGIGSGPAGGAPDRIDCRPALGR